MKSCFFYKINKTDKTIYSQFLKEHKLPMSGMIEGTCVAHIVFQNTLSWYEPQTDSHKELPF